MGQMLLSFFSQLKMYTMYMWFLQHKEKPKKVPTKILKNKIIFVKINKKIIIRDIKVGIEWSSDRRAVKEKINFNLKNER